MAANISSIGVGHGDITTCGSRQTTRARVIIGDDGGAEVSYNGGRSWSSIDNQPTAQFYRVTLDNDFPYHIYGAQQDNSTVRIPSRSDGRRRSPNATGTTSAAARAAGSPRARRTRRSCLPGPTAG